MCALPRRETGYVALAIVVVSWVGQSELAQYIQVHLEYDKPFMVTWINHGAMALLLPVLQVAQRRVVDDGNRRCASAAARATHTTPACIW